MTLRVRESSIPTIEHSGRIVRHRLHQWLRQVRVKLLVLVEDRVVITFPEPFLSIVKRVKVVLESLVVLLDILSSHLLL